MREGTKFGGLMGLTWDDNPSYLHVSQRDQILHSSVGVETPGGKRTKHEIVLCWAKNGLLFYTGENSE